MLWGDKLHQLSPLTYKPSAMRTVPLSAKCPPTRSSWAVRPMGPGTSTRRPVMSTEAGFCLKQQHSRHATSRDTVPRLPAQHLLRTSCTLGTRPWRDLEADAPL